MRLVAIRRTIIISLLIVTITISPILLNHEPVAAQPEMTAGTESFNLPLPMTTELGTADQEKISSSKTVGPNNQVENDVIMQPNPPGAAENNGQQDSLRSTSDTFSTQQQNQFSIRVKEGDTATFNWICPGAPSPSVHPNDLFTCVETSAPSGSSFTSTIGNPASATFTWPNAGPPGEYTETAITHTVFCAQPPPSDPPPPPRICRDSAPSTLTIEVNHPPIANAGPDQTVRSGDTVTLNGVGSSDADGDNLTYDWVRTGSGPAVHIVSNVPNPTFKAPNVKEETRLTFQLNVHDGFEFSEKPDEVTIIVKPKKCTIPTQVIRNDVPYSFEASTLVEASSKFIQADKGIAGLTTWADPVDSSVELDEKGRIICAAALTQQVTVQLPVWTNVGSKCTAIQNEWSFFLLAVQSYEQEHVDLVKQTLEKLARLIIDKTPQGAVEESIKLYNQLQRQSDRIDNVGLHTYDASQWSSIDSSCI